MRSLRLGPARAWVSMLAVAVALGGCTPAHLSVRLASRGVVPFVVRPADLSGVPAPARIVRPRAAPPHFAQCRVSQIHVRWTGGNGATGTTFDDFTIRNVSTRPCSVSPRIGLTVLTASGRTIRAKIDEHFLAGQVVAEDLRPGALATGALLTHLACGSYDGGPQDAVMTADVELILNGQRLPIGQPNGRAVNVRCPPGVQPPGRQLLPPSPQTDGTVYALSAQLRVRAPLRRGTVAWPLLTLTNGGHSPVRLSPCPSYAIGLATVGTHSRELRFRLNCDTVTAIASGRPITYQLRVQVPDGTGLAKLYWHLISESTEPPPPAAAIPVMIS